MQLTKARSSELYKSWKTKQKKHKVKGNCLKGIPRKKQNAPKKKVIIKSYCSLGIQLIWVSSAFFFFANKDFKTQKQDRCAGQPAALRRKKQPSQADFSSANALTKLQYFVVMVKGSADPVLSFFLLSSPAFTFPHPINPVTYQQILNQQRGLSSAFGHTPPFLQPSPTFPARQHVAVISVNSSPAQISNSSNCITESNQVGFPTASGRVSGGFVESTVTQPR